jgi:YD repeat-containing protein
MTSDLKRFLIACIGIFKKVLKTHHDHMNKFPNAFRFKGLFLLSCIISIVVFVFCSSAWGDTIIYQYDDLNRLTNTAYSTGGFEKYDYDSAGNRTSRVSMNPLEISSITNQSAISGTQTSDITFSVNNPNVAAENLTVWGKSSNPALVPKSAIAFGGSGQNRILKITPSSEQTGSATVTVVVNDGSVSAASSFIVTVSPPNHPPLAINDSVQCPFNQNVKVTIQKLFANDSDPDGDPITFSSVSPASLQGGSVLVNGPWVIYTPPTDFNGTDSFTYSITDGRDGNATGTVTVKIQSSALSNQPNSTKVSVLPNGNKQAHFAGIPGFSYTVQASTDLINWVTIGSAQADNLGKFQLEDLESLTQPLRFYRSVYP